MVINLKNYKKTLEYIHSLGMFSHAAGLERITELLNRLGNPQNSLYCVHIAGTNGKGSVATMITSALRSAGYKTGTFVSPYIIDFCERIQVNGEYIPKEKLSELAERVKNVGIDVTEFEFITAVGFLYFKECGCDVCVCETGLGGRFDATNTLPDTSLPVITKIGLDHTAVLGDTLAEIAAEKCGIIKGNIAVTSPWQHAEALTVIENSVSNLVVPDTSKLEIIECGLLGNVFDYKGKRFQTALGGEHQIQNALTAIEALKHVNLDIEYENIFTGLKAATFPARMEVMSRNPLVVLDGAHNPDGAHALKRIMEPYAGKITAIVGMMRDKNTDEFLKITLPMCKKIIAVKAAENSRALTAEEIKLQAQNYCEDIVISENIDDAVLRAKTSSDGMPLFVFGSLYLASAIRNELFKQFKELS